MLPMKKKLKNILKDAITKIDSQMIFNHLDEIESTGVIFP